MEFGYPWWLRVEHMIYLFFVTFLIRSGLEILATYPKLYRKQNTKAGAAWHSSRFNVSPNTSTAPWAVSTRITHHAFHCRVKDCWALAATGTSFR